MFVADNPAETIDRPALRRRRQELPELRGALAGAGPLRRADRPPVRHQRPQCRQQLCRPRLHDGVLRPRLGRVRPAGDPLPASAGLRRASGHDGREIAYRTSSPVLHTETKRPWAAARQPVDRASDADQDSRDSTAAGGVSAATWRRSWVATTWRPAPSEPSLRGSSGERLTYSQTLRKGAAVRGGPQRSTTSRRSGTSVKTDPPSVSGRIGRDGNR